MVESEAGTQEVGTVDPGGELGFYPEGNKKPVSRAEEQPALICIFTNHSGCWKGNE